MKRFVLTFAAVVNLLLVDQIAKAAAVYYLKNEPPHVVLDNLFQLAYVENRGCAWGLFQGQVWPLAVFGVVAFAFLVWKRRAIFPKGAWGTLAEILLYAGILGNLVDRFYLGYVIDMLDIHWGPHHFPCFNIADTFISVAAGLLILLSFTQKDTGKEPAACRPEAPKETAGT